MIRRDLHTHTTFSDGKNTPEEMVQAAIAMGLTEIGFSEHSWVGFDPEPNMPLERIEKYKATVAALKQKYAGQICILCGIEQDYYTTEVPSGYDYVIGSVHYVCKDGQYYAVDDTPEILRDGIEKGFGGDVYALVEAYWDNVIRVVEKTGCSIIGHLDLIRKFNREGTFFDEHHPRYVNAAQKAIDALLKTGKPFEINTGAISRGWQETPYPSADLTAYIRQHGGKLILSSDSHSAQTLCFQFDQWEDWGL